MALVAKCLTMEEVGRIEEREGVVIVTVTLK
jgi:hypothetical protein